MANEIVMPNLGFDTQSGRLVEWLKQPGDAVQRGEVIAIVESDKANVELESIVSGVLLEHCFPADTEVAIGAVIARVGQPGEAISAPPGQHPQAQPQPQAAPPRGGGDASPVARRIAAEHGVDLNTVRGSGVGGRITREDVMALVQQAAPAAGNGHAGVLALPKVRRAARQAGIDLAKVPGTGKHGTVTLQDLQAFQGSAAPAVVPSREGVREIALSRLRKRIGERLGKSKREAPHFYVTGEFDLEGALQKLAATPQLRLNDLLQYLTVQTLLRVPELNATYEDDHLYAHEHVDLAVAVALDEGLITPVIPAAERYSLAGLASESRALIQRARDNRLQPDDLQSGTFTISNLGVIKQVEHFTAVINPPQVAILAVGTVKQRPVVVDGGLHIRHTVHLTLSGDHRVVDGMHLGRFMAIFAEELNRFSQ